MNVPSHGPQPSADPTDAATPGPPELRPLPGEPGIPDITTHRASRPSVKALLALALLLTSLVAAGALSLRRMAATLHSPEAPGKPTLARDKPSAASMQPHRLDLAETSATAPGGASATTQGAASAPLIPALQPLPQDVTVDPDPIAVHATPSGAGTAASTRLPLPEDAPVLLLSTRAGATPPTAGSGNSTTVATVATVAAGTADPPDAAPPAPGSAPAADPMAATTRHLQDYQQRLQALMDQLTQSSSLASLASLASSATSASPSERAAPASFAHNEPPPAATPPSIARASAPSFARPAQTSSTPKVRAGLLGDRSLTLPMGTAFTCALKTKVISATSGFIGCVLQRNLYGDDGRVLLAERGSHLDGEYRVTSVKPGTVRIPVLWTRLRTPLGVTVELESPGTGPLGESGIDGYVDNRWGERIGAALLLSLIDDSVKLVIQNQAPERQADTVVLPSTTANSSKLAEQVLDSTIHIPPLIYQNQGGIVGIYVARDIDFSSVYALEPLSRPQPDASRP